ncbi:MAG: hypothetical protein B5M53_07040 [Candidatus Cloacimonas sp. 4484_209]|nr:MAG: hypothetical protein B5M53_07040 [Candidatus Cloacimonas sp. 4484_209]
MTLPFGIKEGLILGNEARNYTIKSIKKFEKYLKPAKLEYYEYQSMLQPVKPEPFLKKKIKSIRNCICKILRIPIDVRGLAIWRHLPIEYASAKHEWHTEGVILGVWIKR